MTNSITLKRTALALNSAIMALVFVGNYFYLTEGGLLLKGLCSGGFAVMGIINLIFALTYGKSSGITANGFNVSISVGLIFACLGDIFLGFNFILGASLFAVGHICYFISYCIIMPIIKRDLIVGGVIFVCAGAFLLFCPLLDFPNTAMQTVCAVYALIISLMLGKAISNFISERTPVNAVILVGSALFFFSDLMLVFDWFMGIGRIAGLLCMSTYYPAECLLAFSSFVLVIYKSAKY